MSVVQPSHDCIGPIPQHAMDTVFAAGASIEGAPVEWDGAAVLRFEFSVLMTAPGLGFCRIQCSKDQVEWRAIEELIEYPVGESSVMINVASASVQHVALELHTRHIPDEYRYVRAAFTRDFGSFNVLSQVELWVPTNTTKDDDRQPTTVRIHQADVDTPIPSERIF